jgi:hypothetical protein
MARKRKRRSKILLPADDQQRKAKRRKLPVFEAQDLRSLIKEAKASSNDGANAFLFAFRRRIALQMNELLRHLDVDPSQPNAWERGFLLLAHYHHGAGRLGWYPRRSNRNAATWRVDHDYALIREVAIFNGRGLSDRNAIAKLAADRKKRQLFPYREQKRRYFAKGDELVRREAALWSRLQKLRKSARGRSLFDWFGGVRDDGLDFYDRILRDLDMADFLAGLVKNQTHLRSPRS